MKYINGAIKVILINNMIKRQITEKSPDNRRTKTITKLSLLKKEKVTNR